MPTKTISGTIYTLRIDRQVNEYTILWTGAGNHYGYARFDNEYEAAAVWAALGELK